MARDLVQHRQGIVDALQAAMPERVSVKVHQGRFDLAEIKRYSASAPCVLVALLDWDDRDATYCGGPAKFAAYLLTKNGRIRADDQNLVLAGVVSALCKSKALCSDDARNPERVAYRNLYNSYIGDEGLVLGSVSWTQDLELAMPADASLASFITLHVDYDFAPADGVIDAQQTLSIPQE